MTATVLNAGNHERALAPRRHERRRGFGELLTALTRGIDRRHDTSSMREAFEQMLRRITLSGKYLPGSQADLFKLLCQPGQLIAGQIGEDLDRAQIIHQAFYFLLSRVFRHIRPC